MKKYKVEFVQTETFIVDVLAKDEAEAIELAETKWNKLNEAGIIHYNLSDTRLEQTMVYNVTNTDDPFNP